MHFLLLPSGIKSVRIFAGAGLAPMLAAAAPRDGRAGELPSAAVSFSSASSGVAGASWQGAGSQAMTPAAVRPLVITHQKVTRPFAACVEGSL